MYFRRRLLLILFLLLTAHTLSAKSRFIWPVGETLTYRVDWTFVNLGNVTLKVLPDSTIDQKKVHHISFVIRSNPLLFWLDNESRYDSFIDDSLRTVRFISDESVDGEIYKAQYDFDYKADSVRIEILESNGSVRKTRASVEIVDSMRDGIALIFDTREQAERAARYSKTTFFEDKSGAVSFNTGFKKEIISFADDKKKVETWLVEGKIGIEGIAGVTGPYKSWFSADSARVPVKAKLEVFVGSVYVSLIEWKNWQPQTR